MKRTKFLNCILSIMAFTIATSSFAEETIRLPTTEWKPFVGKELEHYGSGTRIVTEAFALEGIKTIYGFFPTKRALFVAQKGEWEGSFFWVRTPEREKYFYFSDIIRSNELVFFHLKSCRFDWEAIDDLKEVRIGVVNGFVYTKEFEEAMKSGMFKVQFTASQEQNLNLLLKKRIDITPIVKQGGYYTINTIFTPKQAALLTHHPRPLKRVHLHLLLPKKLEKSKIILKLFNRGLQRLK